MENTVLFGLSNLPVIIVLIAWTIWQVTELLFEVVFVLGPEVIAPIPRNTFSVVRHDVFSENIRGCNIGEAKAGKRCDIAANANHPSSRALMMSKICNQHNERPVPQWPWKDILYNNGDNQRSSLRQKYEHRLRILASRAI
ncbi:MAG: hypothetical protein ABFS22_03085 [Pseudomonadota bacterium]